MFSKNNLIVGSMLVAATIGGAMSMSNDAVAKGTTWTVEMRQAKLMQDINLAQKHGELTDKEAKKLRDDLSDVARKKKELRNENKATGEKLSPDNKKELEEKLNAISEDIKKKQLEKRAK
jgi:uncharacterized membrane protein